MRRTRTSPGSAGSVASAGGSDESATGSVVVPSFGPELGVSAIVVVVELVVDIVVVVVVVVVVVDVVVLAILIYAALGKLADALTRQLERVTLSWNPAYRTA